jgi:hypothetical protein
MIFITRVNKNGKDYEYETYNNYVMKFEYCRFSFIIINHALIVLVRYQKIFSRAVVAQLSH